MFASAARAAISLLFVLLLLTLPQKEATAGGATSIAAVSGGIPSDVGHPVDKALDAYAVAHRFIKFARDPLTFFGKAIVIQGLRELGLLQGEVPDFPAARALAEIIPFGLGELLLSAPKAY